ncbi:hypothetical protein AB0D16_40600 [Streptomyces sp. NPDC048161]|uniref:hypothetical protein n=1 Tax=Streptomyces sp. NPDC048161 TaxID=3160985 RepID=UPI0033FB2DDD
MNDNTDDIGGTSPRPVSQPLPPEVPAPRAEQPPDTGPDSPDAPAAGTDPDPGSEWWRAPATGVPDWAMTPSMPDPEGPDAPELPEQRRGPEDGTGAAPPGIEGVMAAHEIGAQIGEAISSSLPGHQSQPRRLDLSWMLLKYNIPGALLALLVTWGGRSSVDRVAAMVDRDGLLAPAGVVLLVVLVGAALMVLPIGSWLGAALGHLVSAVAVGLVRLVQRGWSTRYVGYVLRLAVAVAVWSIAIVIGRVIGRAVIHFLTGA